MITSRSSLRIEAKIFCSLETCWSSCTRPRLFLRFGLFLSVSGSSFSGTKYFRICNSESATFTLLLQSELQGRSPNPYLFLGTSLGSRSSLQYAACTSLHSHSFFKVWHPQRTVTFFKHFSRDGHWPGWQVSGHRCVQLGNFLWQGPPHERTLICSFSDKLL